MKINIVALALLFLIPHFAISQDALFTQFFANPINLNPALTGHTYSDDGGRATLNYRNQWQGKYNTTSASWDQEFKKLHGGIGVNMMQDFIKVGLLTSSTFGLSYSFKHKINEDFRLSYGIQTEIVQRSLHWNQAYFQNSIDPTTGYVFPTNQPIIIETALRPNLNLGVFAEYKQFFMGFALHNLTQPNLSDNASFDQTMKRRLTLHGGYNYNLKNNTNWQIAPQFRFMKQHKSDVTDVGCLVSYKMFTTGVFYRHNFFGDYPGPLNVVGLIGFRTKNWRVAYTYDKVINSIFSIKRSHEISLGFAYCRKKVSKEMRKGVLW